MVPLAWDGSFPFLQLHGKQRRVCRVTMTRMIRIFSFCQVVRISFLFLSRTASRGQPSAVNTLSGNIVLGSKVCLRGLSVGATSVGPTASFGDPSPATM